MRSRKEIKEILKPLFDDRRLEYYPVSGMERDEVIIELLLDIRDCLQREDRGKT